MDQGLSKRYFGEMAICLQREGYDTTPTKNGMLQVSHNCRPICQVTGSGGVRYRPEALAESETKRACERVADIAATTAEYMNIMTSALPVKASGLSDDYRILADFKDVVLAGHHSNHGVQFVTWLWDYDRSGVTLGHYFSNDYQGAKRDFALRSGLIQAQKQLTPEHLTVLYLCTDDALNYSLDISYEQEALIHSARSFIEGAVPDLEQRIEAIQEQAQQTQEQTM